MSVPVVVEIPHKLGRAAARARVEAGIGRIADVIPGGTLVEHHWNGDSLACTLGAYGQQVTGRLDIVQDKDRVEIDVPFFLAIFADKLRAKLEREAPKLLEGDAPSPPAA